MFDKTGAACAVTLSLLGAGTPVAAHFQLIYSPDTLIERPGDVPLKLIFWHPFENGHAMDMEKPQEFYAVHRGEKTDLMNSLSEFEFTGQANSAKAWNGSVPVKRSGDYVLVTVPQPYYEESEDIYIQQLTKSFLNRNTVPTDWDTPVGLATEILPLNKPYNVLAGSTFSGQVVSGGEPVAGAEIEVEFMAAEPDMDADAPRPATAAPLPGGSIVALTDANGYFSFGIPKAGFWGFAALGSGPDTEHEGNELSQDAVIWVRAWDLAEQP
ncbi:DUF4198 domain-containing protein [Amaricoccus tamworthensis]|uniref:DUF4198 domain-containing protein n=1 Tax=Amaricoccus tamworthensis TaxID=57002 RepID=UPI003C7C12B7